MELTKDELRIIEEATLYGDISEEDALILYEKIKSTVLDMWKTVKEIVEDIVNYIVSIQNAAEHEEKLRKKWNVQIKMIKPHQVLDRTPLQANIRNSI